MKNYKIDLTEYSGEKHGLLPVPSVFIVNKKGMILFEYVNPDYKVRLEAKTLMEQAKLLIDK